MIIQCINCGKKFEVNSSLIPESGRNLQCSSCNHTWFFTPYTPISDEISEKIDIDNKIDLSEKNKNINIIKTQKKDETKKIKKSSNFGIGKLLSYIIVFIISFFAVILILETFKTSLSNIFPGLEFLLYSLFETIKDISLFFKNLLI